MASKGSPLFVRVVIPPLAEPLTYKVPQDFPQELPLGASILVPLGRRTAQAFVVGEADNTDPFVVGHPERIKEVPRTTPVVRCFGPRLLEFFEWVAKYYSEPLGNVIDTAIPSPGSPLDQVSTYSLTETTIPPLRSEKQKTILQALREAGGSLDAKKIRLLFPGAISVAKVLTSRGLISFKITEGDVFSHLTTPTSVATTSPIVLTEAQQAASETIGESISARRFAAFLLHGVTGSGKTEVYIEAMRHALQQGLDVIVIVPEIALTPQLLDRLQTRIGSHLAVLHSQLSKSVRWTYWQSLLNGRIRVATGARSAVFAPLENAGLIIVDEEHETSFKQSDSFRYHARDLALARAHLQNATIILGSATPSLESYQHATTGKYHYLTLKERPTSRALPKVTVIDLNKLRSQEMASPHISSYFADALRSTTEAGNQAFVLYNRRGFAHYLQCLHCGHVLYCPHCAVTLTFHRRPGRLRCHFCNFTAIPATACSACGAQTSDSSSLPCVGGDDDIEQIGPFRLRGGGTEKVIDELATLFPGINIGRLDRDTVSHEKHYREVLDAVRSGNTQVLVGTQMIAKGHDIPSVTLVGVVDCDVGLHLPDFRAAERAFQLLTQVAGRAGRGSSPGEVVFQTRTPEHPSIRHATNHDYMNFLREELATRKSAGYPPFGRLLRLIACSPDSEQARDILTSLRHHIQQYAQSKALPIKILGPAPAPLERLQGQFRAHMIVKAQSPATLSAILACCRRVYQQLQKPRQLKVVFDLDPQEML